MKINDFIHDQIKFNQYGNELWNLVEEITCPECGRIYRAREMNKQDFEIEKETIEDWGYCLSCDHVRGELLDEEKFYRSL